MNHIRRKPWMSLLYACVPCMVKVRTGDCYMCIKRLKAEETISTAFNLFHQIHRVVKFCFLFYEEN